MKLKFSFLSFLFLIIFFTSKAKDKGYLTGPDTLLNRKLVIYQLLPRLFGNKVTTNKINGSIVDNGSGKFNDISDKALQEIKKLGITYIWYTGVIQHATMTDYARFGIKNDDPDVVKGIAGSPYAIKDYYDVDPDLAVNVPNRMQEFEFLIQRTHVNGLKAIIDFVPNHVSRTYHSNAKSPTVKDFGENDDKTIAFSPKNDFYYIPENHFQVPTGYIAGGPSYQNILKDGKFDENPAKVTGNNVFNASPKLDDWFETIKLNYGVDVQNHQNHFDPIPPVWFKTRDILIYWAKKGVDGFRCDVAEMVPVEFWAWVIPEVKKINPAIIFMGEAYDSSKYVTYIKVGKFDYLYDKVGLYDGLKRLIKNDPNGDVADIHKVTHQESVNIPTHMVRFLENHDEERIASAGFATDSKYALPAMVVSATLGGGPVMIYSGQEVGEPAFGIEGFGGQDNRTTIFDYWGLPNHQKWMNNGAFDGGLLPAKEKKLRDFYQKLLNFSGQSEAIKYGKSYELNEVIGQEEVFGKKVYAYVRSVKSQQVIIVANFDRYYNFKRVLKFPKEFLKQFGEKQSKNVKCKNILTNELIIIKDIRIGLPVNVASSDVLMLSF